MNEYDVRVNDSRYSRCAEKVRAKIRSRLETGERQLTRLDSTWPLSEELAPLFAATTSLVNLCVISTDVVDVSDLKSAITRNPSLRWLDVWGYFTIEEVGDLLTTASKMTSLCIFQMAYVCRKGLTIEKWNAFQQILAASIQNTRSLQELYIRFERYKLGPISPPVMEALKYNWTIQQFCLDDSSRNGRCEYCGQRRDDAHPTHNCLVNKIGIRNSWKLRPQFYGYALLDICIALAPLCLNPYITLWIVDWLRPMNFLSRGADGVHFDPFHLKKLRLIENVWRSYEKMSSQKKSMK